MLADASDYRSERCLLLPVSAIIETVQQDDSVVSDIDVMVTE